ncbi:MAG: CoA transferase [Pseudomonadales bacterium]|nr:CoA transferase [Pseudomonadales bacterium]
MAKENNKMTGALADLKILECTEDIGGPFCGKLLADLGADVMKIESPEGDPSRRAGPYPDDVPHAEKSGRFLYLNANKRSIALDLDLPSDMQVLHDLIRDADVMLLDLAPARIEALQLDWQHLEKLNPRLVLTCITPFGLTGPYRDYQGSDLVSYHAGGLGRETPYNQVNDLENEPPLLGGGSQSEYLTGWTAAACTMAALAWRDVSGRGQCVDVSSMEAIANMLRISLAGISYTGRIVIARQKNGFSWIQPCKDGHVSLSPSNFEHWWQRFKKMAGDPEWVSLEIFGSAAERMMNSDAVEMMMEEWLASRGKQEVFKMALEHGVPGFPVNSMQEVLEAEQLHKRNFFVDVEHPVAGLYRQPGQPFSMSASPWQIRHPAPLLNQHAGEGFKPTPTASQTTSDADNQKAVNNAARLPLEGIRVVDFGWILAVPHATAWLAALGAEVIRIESAARLDLVRVLPGTACDDETGLNRSGAFNGISYSKKSVTLDLSSSRGRELALELVKQADIVTENFTPGVMDRLDLNYESLKAVKPDLIMLSGSPLGQTGPHRQATGWGPNTQSYAGLPFLTGYENGEPVGLGGFYPDFMIGVSMAFSMLTALHYRTRTGKGQYIEFAMAETVASMIPDALIDCWWNKREPELKGNRNPGLAPQGVYASQGDDNWVAISVRSDAEWQALCRVIGANQWADDQGLSKLAGRLQRHDEIDAGLKQWAQQRSHYDAMHELQAAGIAATACLDARELVENPQMLEREFMVSMPHPEVGPRTVAGIPGRYSAMPPYLYNPAPCFGEHNQEILTGLLGLNDDEIKALKKQKIVF